MAKHTELIAEVGQAHDGSLGLAHSYIDALSKTGVSTVKFQVHIAEAESSEFEPFRVPFSYEDKSRYDYWKRMEFTIDQWRELKLHAESVGLKFLASPFSLAAVDLLENLGVDRYKLGSGEIGNTLILNKIRDTGKPVILSTGLSTDEQLTNAVNYLRPTVEDITILHCITAYPSKAEDWALHNIVRLKNLFNLPIGFSDHSGVLESAIAATALGASIIEFHVTFDKQMFGPDAPASLTIKQVENLVQAIHNLDVSFQSANHSKQVSEELKNMFGKSLSVNKNLPEGHILSFDDLESKKPAGKGISASDFEKVIGSKLLRSLSKWSFINYEDLA